VAKSIVKRVVEQVVKENGGRKVKGRKDTYTFVPKEKKKKGKK
jgi:hypothetical protein